MGHLVSSSNHIANSGSGSTSANDSGTSTSTDGSGTCASTSGSASGSDNSKHPIVTVHTSDPVLWMTTLVSPVHK